jgi:hypothetical protein
MERRVNDGKASTIAEESVDLPEPFLVNIPSVYNGIGSEDEPDIPHIMTAIDPNFPLFWTAKCGANKSRMPFTLSSCSIVPYKGDCDL